MAVNMVIAPTGLTYSRNTKAPLIDKVLWASFAEAQAYINNPDETAYVGMTLAVIGDSDSKKNGLYFVESIAEAAGESGSLKKVGSNETLTAATYAAAMELAKTASVGSLIKVDASTGSTEGGDFHAAGFYIVSVAGENPTILILSTSTGEDMDLDQVIAALADVQAAVANKAEKTYVDAELAKKATKDELAGVETAYKAADEALAGRVKTIEDLNISTTYATKDELKDVDDAYKAADEALAGDIALKANQSDLTALSTVVGDADAKSGIFGIISDMEEALKADITAIPKFAITVVESLPEAGEAATVYLVKEKESVGDLYTEYIYVNGAWEDLGKQTVDLSAYSTTEAMNAAISSAISTAIATYKGEVDAELAKKADKDDLKDWVESSVFEQFKTDNTAALDLKADKSDLKDWVESSVFEQFKTDNTAALDLKADASALDAYVLSSAFETYKGEMTQALAGKVDGSAFETYKGEMTQALAGKADASKLSDYVLASVFNTFKTDNAAALDLKADASALDNYVGKSAIEGSEGINGSESLFFTEDGILEVNTISNSDIDTICSLS